MRGRKPNPTALKEALGNPGRRPLNKKEAKLPLDNGGAPKWLDPVGRDLWKELAPQLKAAGLLTVTDRPALAALCAAWSRFRKAEKESRKDPKSIKSPMAALAGMSAEKRAKEWNNIFRAWCTEFGLTPSARSRVQAVDAPGVVDEDDEYFAGPKSTAAHAEQKAGNGAGADFRA